MIIENISFDHVIVDSDNPVDPHCKAAGDIDGDGYAEIFVDFGALGLWWK